MPPKANRLILGSPSPKKRKISPSDKLPGRQYHFYKGISGGSLMEAIPYERQQTLLADMHNNIDEDIFDFNDIRQRHTVQALLNCFLAFSEGSHCLARFLYDTVGDRLFGSKQDSFLDTILVDRLKDTITLLKKDTGPHGVAVVEVLCAAICPTNVEGSPVGVKRTPRSHSSKLVAARLDLPVERVYAATTTGATTGSKIHAKGSGCTCANQAGPPPTVRVSLVQRCLQSRHSGAAQTFRIRAAQRNACWAKNLDRKCLCGSST